MRNEKNLYQDLLKNPQEVSKKIQKVYNADVPRTFQGSTSFSSEELSRVLTAFSIYRPNIGYCQGLNFIAAILISVVGEENAFYLLVKIIDNYIPKSYYSDDMIDFRTDLKMLQMLVKERLPKLFQFAEQLKYEWMMVLSGWILTIFSNSFPVPVVLRIWDSVLFQSQKSSFSNCNWFFENG